MEKNTSIRQKKNVPRSITDDNHSVSDLFITKYDEIWRHNMMNCTGILELISDENQQKLSRVIEGLKLIKQNQSTLILTKHRWACKHISGILWYENYDLK